MIPDLQAMLPAGEWADLQVLNQRLGLMANRNWAFFARAKRIRDGGRAAYIKYIVAAGTQAGTDTLMVTAGTRLEDLSERLKRIQQLEGAVPIVPLIEIGYSRAGLLIAMEEVKPLEGLIARGEAYQFSAAVLRDLDPDSSATGWHHFDVCPNNIGILSSGRCVLIDVESFYLEEEEGKFHVSIPAWKPFRATSEMANAVYGGLATGALEKALAVRKLRFEVALAAAECVLGPLPSNTNNLSRSTIETWVANADASDPAVAFWKDALLAAVDLGNLPSLQELRLRLESAMAGKADLVGAPLAQAPQPVNASEADTEGASRGPFAATGSGWEKEWPLMLPMVHALRAGRLSPKEIFEYRGVLQELATRYPTQVEVWNELLLVVISFEKDPALAWEVATQALDHLPRNEELIRTKNIVQMWARERRRER